MPFASRKERHGIGESTLRLVLHDILIWILATEVSTLQYGEKSLGVTWEPTKLLRIGLLFLFFFSRDLLKLEMV